MMIFFSRKFMVQIGSCQKIKRRLNSRLKTREMKKNTFNTQTHPEFMWNITIVLRLEQKKSFKEIFSVEKRI